MTTPTPGKDNLIGTNGDDFLSGLGGNDTISGGFGVDTLGGDDGDDWLIGGANGDTLNGGAGKDLLDGGTGGDTLTGGLGADAVSGGAGDDVVIVSSLAEAAGDKLDGGAGLDTARFLLSETTTALNFTAARPQQTFFFAGLSLTGFERYVITGGSGRDRLTGGLYADNLSGGSGDDTLSGGGGQDVLAGDSGRDLLRGDAGGDVLNGGADDDTLEGGAGNDALTGGLGSDRIDGGDGDDTVFLHFDPAAGTRERDVILGGAGADTLDLNYVGSARAATIDFGTGALSLTGGTSVTGFERLTFSGGSGNDRVGGGNGADILTGGAGDDTIQGWGGADLFYDGQGADTYGGGDGDDTFVMVSTGAGRGIEKDAVDGGRGMDTVNFLWLYEPGTVRSVTLDLGDQRRNGGLIEGDTYRNIERFNGSGADDTMRGDGGGNVFNGGSGDDVLSGGGGNDTLIGSLGSDTLTGGAGRDVFDLTIPPQFDFARGDYVDMADDTITDFVSGQDKVKFYKFVSNISQFPSDSARNVEVRIENGVGNEASLDGPVLRFDTQTRELWFDYDGRGTGYDPIHLATISTLTMLKAGDVLLA